MSCGSLFQSAVPEYEMARGVTFEWWDEMPWASKGVGLGGAASFPMGEVYGEGAVPPSSLKRQHFRAF